MALSRIPDLIHTYKDEEYTFVGQLEHYLKELECPICKCIVSEPLLTNCGHLFCKECYSKLGDSNSIGWGVKCPVCRKLCERRTTVKDSFNERRVKTLQVRSMNHQYKCKWVGNLNDELQHRDRQGSCQFEEIPCQYNCGTTIRRMTQARHLKQCPGRPHQCQYCGKSGVYQYMVGKHLKSCLKYPARCPNGCKERIPRENTLSYQLKKEIATMEKKLQVKEQRIHALEEDTEVTTEYIRQLEKDAEDMTQQIRDLERDADVNSGRILDLERDNEAKREQLSQLQRENETSTQQINDLQRDTDSKRDQIHDLELDIKAKKERIHRMEREMEAMTQRIHDLERKGEDTTKQLRQLQQETKAKTECIQDKEKATKAKTKQIRHLERATKSKTQHITQLTAENSVRKRKLQCIKKFILFALGIIVLFHLNPFYFVPLLILLLIVTYA